MVVLIKKKVKREIFGTQMVLCFSVFILEFLKIMSYRLHGSLLEWYYYSSVFSLHAVLCGAEIGEILREVSHYLWFLSGCSYYFTFINT